MLHNSPGPEAGGTVTELRRGAHAHARIRAKDGMYLASDGGPFQVAALRS